MHPTRALVCCLLCLPSCSPATGPLGDGTEANRDDIVGGRKTSAFPAVGALTKHGLPHCTGTLIEPRRVLTAAHCLVHTGPLALRFVLGPSIGQAERVLNVESIAPHPGYDETTLENDIGVALLETDAPFEPMRIMPNLDAGWLGKELVFVGYGVTGKGVDAGIKRRVSIPIAEIGPTRFSYEAPGKNTCSGDSGGPALAKVGSEHLVAGVTSYGDVFCDQYGVDTRADAYASFVFGPSPAPPTAADSCEGETFRGRCNGDQVIWCEDGQIKKLTCIHCGFDEQKGIYDCA